MVDKGFEQLLNSLKSLTTGRTSSQMEKKPQNPLDQYITALDLLGEESPQ